MNRNLKLNLNETPWAVTGNCHGGEVLEKNLKENQTQLIQCFVHISKGQHVYLKQQGA